MDVLTFQLSDDVSNLPDALRAAEPQAPKQIKPLMLQAANELHDWQRVASDVVRELTEAAELRAGLMDSESRAAEVQRQVRQTMTGAAARLRALLEK